MSGAATRHSTKPRTKERRTLTDPVTPHGQDNGLFHAAERQDTRRVASGLTDVRPRTRPSRNLFHHDGNREAAKLQQPIIQRDEAAMRSLRFPFNHGDCR